MNLETKITIYKFTPQLFTLTLKTLSLAHKTEASHPRDSTGDIELVPSCRPA